MIAPVLTHWGTNLDKGETLLTVFVFSVVKVNVLVADHRHAETPRITKRSGTECESDGDASGHSLGQGTESKVLSILTCEKFRKNGSK